MILYCLIILLIIRNVNQAAEITPVIVFRGGALAMFFRSVGKSPGENMRKILDKS